ncbi:NADPH:quinone oxidoreductase family protein [Cumulibacter soli]|uniref:NADPH:quinone oxidoreductase family protein n=1 Tax=Cumulibacter soli TaxID=2546344 RepID=UPI001068A3B1|nr:NADPH:quinone oxidoreductase family protein [Cumulibacter soli]
MRAVQVVNYDGPEALVINDIPEPTAGPDEVLIDVHRAGVAFPDLLLSRNMYQVKPEPPFTLSADYAGYVVADGNGFKAGQRVVGASSHGGAQERVAIKASSVFPLPDAISFEEATALPMNYLTAQFALVERGELKEGETVMVNGAAGGVGTASIQVAKVYGARVIALVSNEEKAQVARDAGADEAILLDGFKDEAKRLTDGRGVDMIIDVVGGDIFTDMLRSLAPQGRLMVVGFAGGQGIPEVKVNRLLLNNIDVRGVGWGAFAAITPGFQRQQWEDLMPHMASGKIKPPIGKVYAMEEFGQALIDMDNRKTLGKSVVRIKD